MTFSLPPAIIRWISMLETTQLRQGFGVFEQTKHDGTKSYCALGIFCLANGHPPMDPNEALEWSGNWKPAKEVLGDRGTIEAYRKNDIDRLPFPEIAKWAAVYFSENGPHIETRKASSDAKAS